MDSEPRENKRAPTRRESYPLADAPTPYYLRRFSYNHNGEAHIFDESVSGFRILGSGISSSVKRALPQAAEPEGPAPKRRERDADDEQGPDEFVATSPRTQQNSSAQLANSQDQDTHMDTQQIPPHLPQQQQQQSIQRRHRRRSNTVQPTLLSPTASPRSPVATQTPEYSEMEGSPTDRESTPPLSATQGPPSAHAFAPLPVPFTGPGSPLLPPLEQLYHQHYQSMLDHTSHIDTIKDQLAIIGETFERLPPALHRYTLFNLFRSSSRSTLSALFGELENALRFDILGHLPPEISSLVLHHLDADSVINASEVSRTWYRLVDNDESLWQTLMQREMLRATPKDIRAARIERWGYYGWSTLYDRPKTAPTNIFGQPVNLYKAVYRRLALIHRNWMDPTVAPKRYEIQCPDREVITCLDFSEDIIIASTEGVKHLNVYDTQSGLLLHEFTSHDGGVWALKRVGKDTIVSGSTDHTVRVWSLSKNRCTHVFRGHHATVRCLDVVMPEPGITSRDYPIILTGSRDTTMRMWRLPGPDDEDYDSKGAFVDKENPYFIAELRGHGESVRAVCGHGDVAVSGSYDFRVRVWDLATKKCRHVLEGHENKVYAAIIDPDRNRCISASMDNSIKIWDLETGNQLYTLGGHTGLVGLLGLCDNTLVSAAADKTLRVWNPEDGSLSHCLEGHNTAILCFDHDGRRVVSGSERHLKLWDSRTGTFARDLLTDIEHIWQVSFDRRRCVAAVARGRSSYLEILDFDFEPPFLARKREQAESQGLQIPDLSEIVVPAEGSGTVEEVTLDL